MITGDPILIRFRDALKALYGERIERMVLYGSRARGDARETAIIASAERFVAAVRHALTAPKL